MFPPNIVSSPVPVPQHQSSALTISLQKLTFSVFISFITLKRFEPRKHNFSVSVTYFPSQKFKVLNVDTIKRGLSIGTLSLSIYTRHQINSDKERILWGDLEESRPALIFEDWAIKEYSFGNLKIMLKHCRSLQSADPRGAAQLINYRFYPKFFK